MSKTSGLSLRWAPFAIALPVLIGAFALAEQTSSGRSDPRVLLVGALAGALVAYWIWIVPPAWSISAALALSMFDGNWQELGLPHSVAPDRLVLGVALVALAARAPGARDRPPIRFRPLYALMYVAGAYAIGSAIAVGTITSHSGIFDLLDRMQIMDWFVFIIAPAAFPTAKDRRVLLATLVGMGLYLGATGIFEIIGPHALVFPRYINNPKVGVHFGRARGPFVQAAVNGLALYACTMASVIAFGEWRSRAARAVVLLTIAVCAFSLFLTFQRTIWIGVGVAAPLTLLAVPRLRRYLLPALVGVALIVAVGFAIPSVHRQATARAGDVATVQNRDALDTAAVAMVEARPLFGFGWERFLQVAPEYFKTSNSFSTAIGEGRIANTPLHDVYASIATELGLVGLALWILVLFGGVGGAVLSRRVAPDVRSWQVALGSIFVLWLVAGISSPLAASFQSLIVWLWAAVIVGAQRSPVALGKGLRATGNPLGGGLSDPRVELVDL